jgi:sterol desaturase/sphingolipid hydroxylase (fatty acid hydroxylase superfamily)
MRDNQFLALIILIAVFVPLERFFALHPEQRIFRKGWKTDLVHFFANGFLTQALLVVVVIALAILLRKMVSTDFHALVASQPRWLQFLEAVLVADLAFYGAHRLAHTVPWLWRFHAVHHSSEQMDWLAAARVHPLDQVWNRALIFIPLWMLGFKKEVFGAYLVLSQLQAIFIHANVRFRFGPLRWVMATPEFHHWHHSNDLEAMNRNFAGQLPWLDALFGTLHLPDGRMPQTYGISEPMPEGYVKQLLFPLRRNEVASRALTSEMNKQKMKNEE